MNTSTSIETAVDEILARAAVTFAVRYVGETVRDDNWKCDAWRVGFTKGRANYGTDYFTGLGLRKPQRFPEHHALYVPGKPQTPRAADVLHSLLLDAEAINASFSDWCSDFGADDDSIAAFNTYRACCKCAEGLRAVFSPSELEALREAVREL